jgi:hypothetical protein
MNTKGTKRTLKAVALAAMLIATMLLATGCIGIWTPIGSVGFSLMPDPVTVVAPLQVVVN